MFENFTEKARRIIFFARYEASQLGSLAIGTEHILLGLFREDKDLIRKFFPDPPSSYASIREEIERMCKSDAKVNQDVDLPLSSTAKRALQYAVEISHSLSTDYIGPEHLLFGILKTENSTASRLLQERVGLTADLVAAYIQSSNSIRASSGGISKISKEQLLNHFDMIVHTILGQEHTSPHELIDRIAGDQTREFDLKTKFHSLIDLLVRKELISEDERSHIVEGEE